MEWRTGRTATAPMERRDSLQRTPTCKCRILAATSLCPVVAQGCRSSQRPAAATARRCQEWGPRPRRVATRTVPTPPSSAEALLLHTQSDRHMRSARPWRPQRPAWCPAAPARRPSHGRVRGPPKGMAVATAVTETVVAGQVVRVLHAVPQQPARRDAPSAISHQHLRQALKLALETAIRLGPETHHSVGCRCYATSQQQGPSATDHCHCE
mmetsp:Transcript_5685/g.14540  ORF Transcript_5685/g.14540 Transcript_5685/m.14540 type:complete len:211 (-) Transcript_5685:116-748(-)